MMAISKHRPKIMFDFYTVVLLILVYNDDYCEGKQKEVVCPDYCVCDHWNGLKRAACQNKRLYSIEIGMPSLVEILDISHNQVSEIGGNIFLKTDLTNLKLLNLSHNRVSQIHLDGFEGLKALKTLDLSFNAVQYFNDHWFTSLESLQELYLRGNNLVSINDEKKLNFLLLRALDISQCKITHLRHGSRIFEHLPRLETLDVSDNLLLSLHVDLIDPLKNLSTLLANNNPFKCEHTVMAKLRNHTIMRGIHYEDSCGQRVNVSRKVEAFQRMVEEKPVIPEKNSWIYDDEDDGPVDHNIVCKEHTTLISKRNIIDEHLMKIIDLSPSLVLLITLICGINIGILFGCLCQFKSYHKAETASPDEPHSTPLTVFRRQGSLRDSINRRTRTRSCGSRRMFRDDHNNLLDHENHIYDSTPILTRKIVQRVLPGTE